MALTDDARKEIAEAIRIVREDRFEAHARGVFTKFAPKEKEEKPKDELIDEEKEKEGITPPPEKKKEEKIDPPQPVNRSRYWGEILE